MIKRQEMKKRVLNFINMEGIATETELAEETGLSKDIVVGILAGLSATGDVANAGAKTSLVTGELEMAYKIASANKRRTIKFKNFD